MHFNTFEVFDPRFENIGVARSDVYSQFGEDGLIAVLLATTGKKNEWCFEVGAADGVYLSNTKRLRDPGFDWHAVLIEADDDKYKRLEKFRSQRVRCVRRKIGDSDLDGILRESGAPTDIDLGVIDIDDRDYYAWQGMVEYRPRVMMVECWGLPVSNSTPTELVEGKQATSIVLNRLAIEKGYTPICRTFCNCLYVRTDAL